MEHQDTMLTSMRPRLKELNDIPYSSNGNRYNNPRTIVGFLIPTRLIYGGRNNKTLVPFNGNNTTGVVM